MPESSKPSVFQEYYSQQPLVDRFASDPTDAVDVIIPIIHTNELWKANLLSIYREIPVKRLLIGDGGCIDNSLDVVKAFPRVTVFDHRKFVSLGFSIRKLIEEVETEWFVYLHSDVYLPPGWFEEMNKFRDTYDWYECRQHLTILVDYPMDYAGVTRSLSGSQMGRKSAFQDVLPKIDDDYLYRNEDLIYSDLITRAGFRYGRVDSMFHYHQLMNKKSAWRRTFKHVDFIMDKSREEEVREFTMQLRGLIKYTQPTPLFIDSVIGSIRILNRVQGVKMAELRAWAAQVNPAWLPHLRFPFYRERIRKFLLRLYNQYFN